MRDALKEIDRILASEPAITPSPHFAASVMVAVQMEASLPQLTFPWGRFLIGCILSAAIAALSSMWVSAHGGTLGDLLPRFGSSNLWAVVVPAVISVLLTSLISFRVSRELWMRDPD